MELVIKFDLVKTILSEDAKNYWIYGEGNNFFLEKTKDILLHLNKGDYFEFEAHCNEPKRDIIKDFGNGLFKIKEKSGFVSVNGESRLIYTIEH